MTLKRSGSVSQAQPRLEQLRHKHDEALLDEILEHLQRYCSELWFEIGGHPDHDRELIISAEGKSEFFDDVRRLVACAPEVAGWRFIAFKPAQGFEFRTEYEGIEVDPSTSWFLPMHSVSDPSGLGLRIAVPGFNEAQEGKFRAAVSIVLETGLGELWTAEHLRYLEVVAIPDAPEAEGFIGLNELDRYLASRKTRHN